jgi:hypothetical protein
MDDSLPLLHTYTVADLLKHRAWLIEERKRLVAELGQARSVLDAADCQRQELLANVEEAQRALADLLKEQVIDAADFVALKSSLADWEMLLADFEAKAPKTLAVEELMEDLGNLDAALGIVKKILLSAGKVIQLDDYRST